MRVHVGGDGSFLALVDTRRYRSFVDGDWSEGQRLYEHLCAESAHGRMLSWGTGFECDWPIHVQSGLSATSGFREFVGTIVNTGDALHLVNYDSLTMAAQFDDHLLPDDETVDYAIPLPPGAYRIRVVQMLDPASRWWEELDEDSPAFLIEYEAIDASAATGTRPQWWDGQ